MNTDEEATESPRDEWAEGPITLTLIRQIAEEHPEYRKTEHWSRGGNRYILLEVPESGEYEPTVPNDFVSMIESLGGD